MALADASRCVRSRNGGRPGEITPTVYRRSRRGGCHGPSRNDRRQAVMERTRTDYDGSVKRRLPPCRLGKNFLLEYFLANRPRTVAGPFANNERPGLQPSADRGRPNRLPRPISFLVQPAPPLFPPEVRIRQSGVRKATGGGSVGYPGSRIRQFALRQPKRQPPGYKSPGSRSVRDDARRWSSVRIGVIDAEMVDRSLVGDEPLGCPAERKACRRRSNTLAPVARFPPCFNKDPPVGLGSPRDLASPCGSAGGSDPGLPSPWTFEFWNLRNPSSGRLGPPFIFIPFFPPNPLPAMPRRGGGPEGRSPRRRPGERGGRASALLCQGPGLRRGRRAAPPP